MHTVTGMEAGILYNSAAGAIIFSLIFLYLFLQSREEYLKSYTLFWGFSALSFLAAAAIYSARFQPVSGLIYFAGVILAGLFLLDGSYKFFDENMSRYWRFLGFIALGAGLSSAYIWEGGQVSLVFLMTFLGLAYLKTGILYFKNSHTTILKAIGVAAVVFAAVTFIYPYIHQQEWFIPAGNSFLGGVGTFLGLGLIGAHYKELQNKVERIKDRYKSVVETQEELICRFKPDTTLTFVNNAYCRNIGYPKEKLLGKKFVKFMSEEDEQFAYRQLEKAKDREEKINFKHKLRDEKGEIKYQRWTYRPIFDKFGEIEEFQAVGFDVTEREREREKLEAIFEASQNVSFIITEPVEDGDDALIKEFSPGSENIFGYEREEVIDRSVSLLHSSEEADKFDEIHRQLARGERWEDRVELVRKNGEKFPALFTVYPFESKSGNDRVLGVSIEITELEDTREKLERTRNQLEAILESIQDGISVLDPDLNVKYINSTMENWYEKNAPLEEKKCYQVLRNRDEPCSNCPTLRCIDSGEVESEVVPGLESSNTDYLEAFAYPMIDEDTGEISGVVEFLRDITERKNTEKELEMTKFFLDNADMMVFRVTPEGEILYANERVSDKLGYSTDELENLHANDIIAEKDFIVREKFWKQIKQNDSISYQRNLVTAEGEIFPASVVSQYFQYEDEEYEFVFARDITERKEMEEELKIKEQQYRKIFETAPVGIMLEDDKGNILNVNDTLCQMSGFSEDELVGNNVLETLTPIEYRDEARKNIKRVIKGEDLEFTGVSRKKTGEKFYVHLSETRVSLPQEGEGILSIQMDITDLKEKEERLKYLSYHDGLTGLYNRSYMEEEMQRLDTERQLPISLIMCDVNGMKIVNDTYGHKVGDELLNKVADILKEITRDEDIVSRWAGDEFVILLPQTEADAARRIGKRIEEACKGAKLGDIPITLGIGLATKRNTEEEFEDVLTRADERMYKDKLTKANSAENRLVDNMLNTLAAKSAETKEHAMRMTDLAHKLGDEAGLSGEQLNRLSLLATLHDIGKTTIAEDILTKPEGLSDEEWQTIKEHPERGHTILTATDDFAHIAKEVLHHHEHWDGKGYPEGLEEEEIPLLARMIAIVDAYDVMTTGRPYKDPMCKEEALREIENCAGSQFDPELAEIFIEMMKES